MCGHYKSTFDGSRLAFPQRLLRCWQQIMTEIDESCDWLSLPEEIWQLVLYCVPLPDRLGACSRVSTRLYMAAAATTQHLEVDLGRRAQQSQGFRDWLQQHGQHVSSLQLSCSSEELAELPCQHLRQLRLEYCSVQLQQKGTSSSQAGILSSLLALTRLRMDECRVTDSTGGLAALAACTGLQHLELAAMVQRHGDAELPASMLQQLTRLTCLHLDTSVCPTAASLEHISSLQHLQELRLEGGEPVLSPSSTPGLMKLTALIKLVLHSAQLDPTVLCDFRQLQHLDLRHVTILGAPDATPLLSLISRQQQLQVLTLLNMLDSQTAASAAAYAALTASSKLLRLSLSLQRDALPAVFWQALFRPGQQLPDLQSCRVFFLGGGQPQCSTADITALASCRPGLQRLNLLIEADAQLAALSQLTALTDLEVHSPTAASLQSLAAVTQLRTLRIRARPAVDQPALLPLTSLQGLGWLVVTADNHRVSWRNESPDPDQPDVWQQLLKHSN